MLLEKDEALPVQQHPVDRVPLYLIFSFLFEDRPKMLQWHPAGDHSSKRSTRVVERSGEDHRWRLTCLSRTGDHFEMHLTPLLDGPERLRSRCPRHFGCCDHVAV